MNTKFIRKKIISIKTIKNQKIRTFEVFVFLPKNQKLKHHLFHQCDYHIFLILSLPPHVTFAPSPCGSSLATGLPCSRELKGRYTKYYYYYPDLELSFTAGVFMSSDRLSSTHSGHCDVIHHPSVT